MISTPQEIRLINRVEDEIDVNWPEATFDQPNQVYDNLSINSNLRPDENSFNPSLSSPSTSATYKLYKRRWFVLILFSSLAMLNNVVCYSFASINQFAMQEYPAIGQSLSHLITYFFITYVIFSIPSAWIIDKFGLRTGLVIGSWLQCIGCLMRWYDTPSGEPDEVDGIVCWLKAGQLIASLGQAFFVNPPPLMASMWFGPDERVLATTIAVNANTLGIAGAYLLGSHLVSSAHDIPFYLLVIAGMSIACAFMTTFFLPARPPTPPSYSAHHAEKHYNPAMTLSLQSIWALFQHKGFFLTCLAFALSEAIINGLSAFMPDILIDQSIGLIGWTASGFIVSCMFGSAILGWFVDRTHTYKSTICGCLVAGSFALWYLQKIDQSDNLANNQAYYLVSSILAFGFFIGPVQPLVMEVAVECTYPSSASTVAALQQILGNLVSAAVFPVITWLRTPPSIDQPNDQPDAPSVEEGPMDRVLLAMCGSLFVMALLYATFRGDYRRLRHESCGHLESPTETQEEAMQTIIIGSPLGKKTMFKQAHEPFDEKTSLLYSPRSNYSSTSG